MGQPVTARHRSDRRRGAAGPGDGGRTTRAGPIAQLVCVSNRLHTSRMSRWTIQTRCPAEVRPASVRTRTRCELPLSTLVLRYLLLWSAAGVTQRELLTTVRGIPIM
jgi:hypothetical protein